MLLQSGHNRMRTELMRLSHDTGEKVTARAFFLVVQATVWDDGKSKTIR